MFWLRLIHLLTDSNEDSDWYSEKKFMVKVKVCKKNIVMEVCTLGASSTQFLFFGGWGFNHDVTSFLRPHFPTNWLTDWSLWGHKSFVKKWDVDLNNKSGSIFEIDFRNPSQIYKNLTIFFSMTLLWQSCNFFFSQLSKPKN